LTHSARYQRTIARPAQVTGFGYWSGQDCQVDFRPAPVDRGITFIRRDLTPAVCIPATWAQRVDTPRRTTLMALTARVEMVEHILAALAGLHIDNCEVVVSAAEMPGCDGSCLPFTNALLDAGIVEQRAERPQWVVRRTTRVGDGQRWVEIRPPEGTGLTLQYHLDYGPGSAIGRQSIRVNLTPEAFYRALAPARTFLLDSEARQLRQQGLGTRVTSHDLLVFDERGPIGNRLRFPDECVRHKTLDLVGDLALAGCDLVGHVVAYRSGHQLNAELVTTLLAGPRRLEKRIA
jgi:UDP-3-O-acyl N-acetylglucosamine deacetylase